MGGMLLLILGVYLLVKSTQKPKTTASTTTTNSGGVSASKISTGTFFDRLKYIFVGGIVSGGGGTGITVSSPYTSTDVAGSAAGGSLSGISTIHNNVRVGNGQY